MPALQRSEFALALNQVASERGVDVEVVLDTVKNAILAAYRKDHPGTELEEYTAELNPNTGEAKILHNEENVTPPGFGRIAAQTAKQVILQKIREREKEAILSDFRVKVGTIINGMVLRFAGPNIIIDIGKTEALMPVNEQINSEKYHLNQRFSIYIVEIREGMKGEEIIVSRSHTGLIEGLFKREVPEVSQGSVQIKAIVREAGNRCKVAVYSDQAGIDPVGSCVGQKGVRVQAIIQEFNGIEKIDIIQWSEDATSYIAQALSPAKHVAVKIDEEAKVAHVTVPQDELSLAIGKDGQNVRLASKLTGYRIEIDGQESKGSIKVEGEGEKGEEVKSDLVAAEEVVEKPKKTRKKKDEIKAPELEEDIETVEEEAMEIASEEQAATETKDEANTDTPTTTTDAIEEKTEENS